MGPDASAYKALGLEPGADAATVEAAYRKLIKRHHPDIAGGNSDRAAEINWAYNQIRTSQRLPGIRRTGYPVVPPRSRPIGRPRAGRWFGFALALLIVVLLVERSEVELSIPGFSEPLGRFGSYQPSALSPDPSLDPVDQPLDSDAIDRSVIRAVRLARDGNVDQLATQSRRCHSQLRQTPALSRLDQCIAFDEAVVVLLEYNRLEDGGQFSTSAVTGRQLGAARLFSEDYLEIESRLDRIRAQVEFNLAAPDPQPAPALHL